MKKYICPVLECAEFKPEEKLASSCTGSCTKDYDGYVGSKHVVLTAFTYS